MLIMKLDFANRRIAVTARCAGHGQAIVRPLPPKAVLASTRSGRGRPAHRDRVRRQSDPHPRPRGSRRRRSAFSRDRRECPRRRRYSGQQCAGGVRGQVGSPSRRSASRTGAFFEANVHGAFWCSQCCASDEAPEVRAASSTSPRAPDCGRASPASRPIRRPSPRSSV